MKPLCFGSHPVDSYKSPPTITVALGSFLVSWEISRDFSSSNNCFGELSAVLTSIEWAGYLSYYQSRNPHLNPGSVLVDVFFAKWLPLAERYVVFGHIFLWHSIMAELWLWWMICMTADCVRLSVWVSRTLNDVFVALRLGFVPASPQPSCSLQSMHTLVCSCHDCSFWIPVFHKVERE